jgi:transcription initiation factor TFIIIB Brf1 subunit/transcription initiation factor TFIIB
MRKGDTRTLIEKIGDLLAEDHTLDEIAHMLQITYGQVRNRYLAMCASLGVRPDAE